MKHYDYIITFGCHDNAGANPSVAWEGAREGSHDVARDVARAYAFLSFASSRSADFRSQNPT